MPQHQQIMLKYYHVFIILNKEVKRQNSILKQGFAAVNCHGLNAITHSAKTINILFLQGITSALHTYYAPETKSMDGKALQLHLSNRDQIDLVKRASGAIDTLLVRDLLYFWSSVAMILDLVQPVFLSAEDQLQTTQESLLTYPLVPSSVDLTEQKLL